MLVLTLRTDKPEAELGLYDNTRQLDYLVWEGHRQLAETLHQKIQDLLSKNDKELRDVEGLAVYRGPGSFTGLRIGLSTANALAYGLGIPIASAEADGWLEKALEKLINGQGEKAVMPEYGSDAHITTPKK